MGGDGKPITYRRIDQISKVTKIKVSSLLENRVTNMVREKTRRMWGVRLEIDIST